MRELREECLWASCSAGRSSFQLVLCSDGAHSQTKVQLFKWPRTHYHPVNPGASGLRAVVHFVWFSLVCVHIYRCEGLIIMSRMLNAVLYSVLVMCMIQEQSAKWVFVSNETRLSPTVVHNWNGLQRWRTTWHWQLKSQNTDLMWSYPFPSGQKQWFKTTLCSKLCSVRWRQTNYWPCAIVFCIFWFKKVILPLMPNPLRQCLKHNSLIGKMS